ncbi:DUF456 domain-containing protein [Tomitella biformata]|uniref:DUF456 domain-containing protein n=1 Tax=Tomitella biformata TaxID=630403 RepID=UPI0004663489|nr:DUF456 domain-containing protein [Tomitella biformata]
MSATGELLIGLAILVGLVGVVLPVLPGALIIGIALLVWAIMTGTTAAWVVFAIAFVLLVGSGIVKYTWPGQRLRDGGVPTRALIVGGLVGIVGFFVVPVVGLVLGFLLGTFVAELIRLRAVSPAWVSTWAATKAVGLSMLVELVGALAAAGLWLAAVVAFS